MNRIVLQDNLEYLRDVETETVDLIYVDPPFNTGVRRQLDRMRVRRDASGSKGFGDNPYIREVVQSLCYDDSFDDFLGFMEPRMKEAHRVLKSSGSLYFHIDYREVHYCKVMLDGIFGRTCFMNEIVWAYDFGAKPKTRWPAKHDNILFYVKNPDKYTFNVNDIDRIPYMAPGLVAFDRRHELS